MGSELLDRPTPSFAKEVSSVPQWRTRLDQYNEIHAYEFETYDGLKQAIHFIFNDPTLKGVPCQVAVTNALFLPKDAIAPLNLLLCQAKVSFCESRVVDMSEFPPDIASLLRKEAGLVY